MVLIKWKNPLRGGVRGCSERCRNLVTLTRLQICLMISRMTFVICCLTYNDHLNCNYVIDFLLEPIHRFVDNFAKYLGKMFVLCVVVLTTAVVLTAYWVGFPYWWERNPHITVCLVIYGNWLLLNILFHYYMGVTTHPGYPPKNLHLTEASSVCKKCITLKPSRAHHCSVCDRCILAMDHHCPWLNNCVGHYNVRYFYLYMVYMVAGVVFIIIAGLELGYQVMWVNDTGGLLPNNDPDLIGHPVRIDQSGSLIPVREFDEYDAFNAPREYDLPVPPITEAQRICAHSWKRRAVFFMAFTCVGVAISLTTLLIIHGKHISKGETSVESAVNARSRGIVKSFKHPYNFGRVMNWKLFLGLTQGRGFVRHVLFPSRHRPMGNGVFWHTVVDYNEGWP